MLDLLFPIERVKKCRQCKHLTVWFLLLLSFFPDESHEQLEINAEDGSSPLTANNYKNNCIKITSQNTKL